LGLIAPDVGAWIAGRSVDWLVIIASLVISGLVTGALVLMWNSTVAIRGSNLKQ
jgi:hypothetical protein